MKIITFSLLLLLQTALRADAQLNYHLPPVKRTTGNSGTGANINVNHHRFEWYLDPDGPKNIRGNVTTYFTTTQDKVKNISFDFNKNSFDNSNLVVKYRGKVVAHHFSAGGNENILNITLPSPLPDKELDSITIFYSGTPPPVSGQAEGFQQRTLSGSGTSMYYTLSESYEDKDWWPCKADMQDKIDSVDFIITTPTDFRAAANGVLVRETLTGNNKTYYFKHRYPIASYLIAVAVARYNVFDRGTVTIGGTAVPVDYYITVGRGSHPEVPLNAMDLVKQELIAFSEKFGDYPFKKEKYGMYEFGWAGGMEHQTFSAMGWGAMSDAGTIAHELMHQWFGDKVTFATWEHLWLAEGFARYGEALAAELVPALGIDPVSKRASFKNAANNSLNSHYGCLIPRAMIANSNTLWGSRYGSTVYERGAMVVSMLRTLAGDEKFFRACRNFLNDPLLAYGSAVTNDLKRHFEAVLDGFDLTPFFDAWVSGNGYPSYRGANAINWWNAGNGRINIGIKGQSQSEGSNVSYYFTPIPLLVQGAGGRDTLLILYDQDGSLSRAGEGIGKARDSSLQFQIGFEPTAVVFDPFNMSLATGSTVEQMVTALYIDTFNVTQNKLSNRVDIKIDGVNDLRQILLERSYDGVTFEEIGEMRSSGERTGQLTLEDPNPFAVTYYRAKITDFTGRVLYSKSLKITGNENPQFSLLNNPVSGNIKIRSAAQVPPGTNLNIKVFDSSGRKHLDTDQKVAGSILEIGNNLKSGTYFLKISGKEQKDVSLRLIVR